MNAVLQPSQDALAQLPASDAPWTLTFDPWPHADAQRWRAVMATSARGRLVLLADRPLEPLLRLRIESRLKKPLLWWPCEPADIDALLEAGEADYRALGALGEVRRQPREVAGAILQAGVHRAHQYGVAQLGEAQVQRGEQMGIGAFVGWRHGRYACVRKREACRETAAGARAAGRVRSAHACCRSRVSLRESRAPLTGLHPPRLRRCPRTPGAVVPAAGRHTGKLRAIAAAGQRRVRPGGGRSQTSPA